MVFSFIIALALRKANFASQFCAIDPLLLRATQREYSSKPLKHSIVKRILVFKR